ncbi:MULTISPECIES: AraC family transcriptional regulator [unclassified Geodermatophilus]
MLPRIRTNSLTGYAQVARSSGLRPEELTAQVGLDLADLAVPDRWIPAAPAARLLELSAQRADCPEFALRLAEVRTLGTLGPLSVVLREEPDLRSALDLLTRYERAYNEALHLRLQEDDDEATVEVWLELGEPAPRDQALDLVMAALVGIVRALVRSDWEPLSASFARPPPPDAGPWRRHFGPRVDFGRRFTGLLVRTRDLDARVVTADPSLRPYARQFLHTVVVPAAPTATDGPTDVAAAVELLLPLGRQSLARASRLLGLSARELQRHLAERGDTFSSVLSTTRARLAERYLPDEGMSLTEVSRLLGFTAPSAFSRWFREQFGTSPTEWRRRARTNAPSPQRDDAATPGPRTTVRGG